MFKSNTVFFAILSKILTEKVVFDVYIYIFFDFRKYKKIKIYVGNILLYKIMFCPSVRAWVYLSDHQYISGVEHQIQNC